MDAHIKESELTLLAFLHEKAGGYGRRHALYEERIAEAMDISMKMFEKDSSYLAEHGLVGLDRRVIFLTGEGERYMRALEAAPGVGTRVTTTVVKQMKDALVNIATSVLTEYVKTRMKF